jgi:hypothetical protein
MKKPSREQVVGQVLVGIAHSRYSEPEFIVQGIGPASFRSHYLVLANGLVIELSVAGIEISAVPLDAMECETVGLSPDDLFSRSIAAVVKDDVGRPIVVLDGAILVWDGHDAFYRNPLAAGTIADFATYNHYGAEEFFDYWTGESISIHN